jgi:hypothetical protein
VIAAKDETIDRLDAEVAYLRDQLDMSRRELAAERERFDVIHREALSRIEALTAGETARPQDIGSVENVAPGATGEAVRDTESEREPPPDPIGPPAWRRAEEGHELGPDREPRPRRWWEVWRR